MHACATYSAESPELRNSQLFKSLTQLASQLVYNYSFEMMKIIISTYVSCMTSKLSVWAFVYGSFLISGAMLRFAQICLDITLKPKLPQN